jgi:hypothetical protein
MERNKLIGLLAISCLIILIISGAILVSEHPKELSKENTKIINPNGIYSQCYYPFYQIEVVDSLQTDNCYAIKNSIEKDRGLALDSLNHTGEDPYDYLMSHGLHCAEVNTHGLIYCLRDNSSCLEIEGKICNIINLTEKK